MTRKPKTKPATVGTKIASDIVEHDPTWNTWSFHGFLNQAPTPKEAAARANDTKEYLARRIDAAVGRAVKEAWAAGKEYQRQTYEGCDGSPADQVERIERKYNVKL